MESINLFIIVNVLKKPILLLFSANRSLEFFRASGKKKVHDTAEKGKREKIGGEEEKKDEKED